jgi:site-specific DNA recombinase
VTRLAEDGHSPAPPIPIDAVGYVRVSFMREEAISPELQRASIESAAARDGAKITEWIEELDESGRGFGRKGVQRAIRLVESGAASAIYVWRFSRFGRNSRLMGAHVQQVEESGGRVVSATEDIDARTAIGKFMRRTVWNMDELYSDMVGDTWREAQERRRKLGLPHNGNPRFGYLYHHPTLGAGTCPQGCAAGQCEPGYVPDPATAPAAEGMYEAYNAGQSVLRIAVGLNARGLLTTAGKPWDQRTVRRYMDSGFCAGLLRVHDPDCEHPVKACPVKVLIDGTQPPLISEATWKEYLRQRDTRRNLPPRQETPAYPLAGLVKCGRCGQPLIAHPMTYNGVRKPGYMYQCSRYIKSRSCPGTWVARHRVEAGVRAWLLERAAGAVAESGRPRPRPKVAGDAVRRRLAAEALREEAALTELTLQLGRKVIDEEAYALSLRSIRARRAEISAALEATSAAEERAEHPPVAAMLALARDWDILPVQDRQVILRSLVGVIAVQSHGGGKATMAITPLPGGGNVYFRSL